jgi:hypothetical protein
MILSMNIQREVGRFFRTEEVIKNNLLSYVGKKVRICQTREVLINIFAVL